ncbi:zf-TFIIB domain-containing protein [Leifsonia sp. YIM 134122]|uniref:Zf-TFIIB domain-containing protein n=1 Tax=Leifsonia stereocauli TaxID=3134136 RepID=A0ABU9W9V4_9MICO
MQCPNDQSVLVMSERSGVEIDYCPTCRGVWLDRGELDKILERAGAELRAAQDYRSPAAAPAAAQSQPGWGEQQPAQAYGQQGYDERGHDDRRYDDRGPQQSGDQGYYRKKKRESWLSELFD